MRLIYLAAKVRLGFLIMACALAGIAVSPSSALSNVQIIVLAVAVLLSSSITGAFNQLYERDIDAVMSRTQHRPFVTGQFLPSNAWKLWLFFLSLIAIMIAYLAANMEAALFLFAGSFTYAVIYTVWLKRKTWMNIVIGGFAGSFAVLVGSAATGSTFAPAPLILAVILFLWTPPHFWALAIICKEDYSKASIPMLPLVASELVTVQAIFWHTLILVLLSFSLIFYGMNWVYLLFAVTGGGYFVYTSYQLAVKKTPHWARKTFYASIIHLGLLLIGTMIDAIIFVNV